MTKDYLFVESAHVSLDAGKAPNRDTSITSRLDIEHICWLRTELKHHCGMIKLRARESSRDRGATACTCEEQNVICVCLRDKLLLRYLLCAPELVSLRG